MAKVMVSFMIENPIEVTLMKHLSTTLELILANDREYEIRNHFQANYIQMLQAAVSEPDSNVKY